MNWQQLGWFVAVGGGAAFTHAAVLAASLRLWPDLPAPLANALGFIVAFGVSFAGHRLRTFAGSRHPVRQSLVLFGLTSALGFATHSLLFATLHSLGGVGLWWSWLLATVTAAAQTFSLGKFWAFRR